MKEAEALRIVANPHLQWKCVEVDSALTIVRNALEKQITKKPEITRTSCGIPFGICPNCGEEINRLDNPFYHTDKDCLQKLDWSEV